MNKNDEPFNEPGLVFDDEIEIAPEPVAPKVAETPIVEAQVVEPVLRPEENLMTPPPSTKPVESVATAAVVEDDEALEFIVEPEDVSIVDVVEDVPEGKKAEGTAVQVIGSTGLEEKGPERQRMGDKLVSMGLITPDQLNVALQEKKISNKMIGEIFVDLGFIDAETLTNFLATSSGLSVFDPKTTIMDASALELVNKEMAQKHLILPFSIEGDDLLVAMADPYDIVALDILRKHLPKNLKVKPAVTTPQILSDAIDVAYGYASSVSAILKELEGQDADDLGDVAGLSEDEAYSHPLVRLVNALIFEAVKGGASDLHFEPEENFVRLRYRLDGVLSTVQILHRQHWNGISQRIKLMASLNIADKLSPQDGRIKMAVGGRDVDFRVSSLPTVYGENIVMRVLDKQSSIMPLSDLGFSDHNKDLITRAQKRPEGIVIVTGPTGSGKTTTLYSMLNEINTVDVNIQTLEDPVEYSLPMIRQTQIREGILEFADGIRALLRQDPDIIFIGEIRDKVTAEMALQAAMTGHQVYTSLHTNDSFGALPRLFDLGMVPGMVAGNIISIFAQRLTRTLCSNCKQPHAPTDEECKILGVTDIPEIFTANKGGCSACAEKGYKGRIAVVEILSFDEDMDEVVARGGTKIELKDIAVAKGFKNMKDDAMLKILDGITTFEAVSKVVDITN